MPAARFVHVTLRTLGTDAARSFYAKVLGDGAWDIVQLHDHAVARGARPHWLGYLEVEDVDDATSAFLRRGATALGPRWVNARGVEGIVVREPGGAVLALARLPGRASARELEPGATAAGQSPEVVWHQLDTIDVDRAKEDYRTLFGWSFGAPIATAEHGVFHPFSWEPGAAPVGWMTDVDGRPGRRPHWLFHFRVAALDPAMAAVRSEGGVVIGPFEMGDGQRVAVCDDAQSAAFAIRERQK
jgi:uncharacterized protein